MGESAVCGWKVYISIEKQLKWTFMYPKIVFDLIFLQNKIFTKCQHNSVFPIYLFFFKGSFSLAVVSLSLSRSLSLSLPPSTTEFSACACISMHAEFSHTLMCSHMISQSTLGGTDQIYRYVAARRMRRFRFSFLKRSSVTWQCNSRGTSSLCEY